MAIEFRNSLLGFNKDDVLNYVYSKDAEFKALSKTLNSKISNLENQLEELKAEHLSALSTIGNLTYENELLKIKISEYEKKAAEVEEMSAKIGKLYLVSKSTAKTIVDKAEENFKNVNAQTEKSIENLENTQASLKDITENILSASRDFVGRIDQLQNSLCEVKDAVAENNSSSAQISQEFAELYAKLG